MNPLTPRAAISARSCFAAWYETHMVVTPNNKALPDRRTMLRATGLACALPLLEGMGMDGAPPPARALWVFLPNGMNMGLWRPKSTSLAQLSPTLQPLAAHRSALTVISGLAIEAGRAGADGAGDHARAAATFLSCARAKKTDGADIAAGLSVDQFAAQHLGAATPLASLELGCEPGRLAGGCDSGYSCAYSNTVSWSSPTTPCAKETSPRRLFERLFGDMDAATDVRARALARARKRSILDWLSDDAKRLSGTLSAPDRAALDAWLTALRALEKRLAAAEDARAQVPNPELLTKGTGSHAELIELMGLLLTRAFEGDQTRIATLMVGNAGSNRPFREVDWSDGHHDTSHHGKDPKKLAAIGRINAWHMERLATLLDALSAAREADGCVLDRTIVMMGCGISDGDRHNHDDLPVLLAGGRALGVRGGHHLELTKPTPMANLHLAMLRKLGIKAQSFADSTSALPIGA